MSIEPLNGINVYFVAAQGPSLCSEQDALDLLGETYGTTTDMIVVPVERFAPEFFDLSTRLAGHFFQKLQNYQMRLAILGDISAPLAASKALRDFVGETNRIGHHLFASDRAALAAGLGRKD
ncbi:DUF4180 domain-containing protein [Devosia sp. XJ19-1]|uniref:DUF4180 domain-containing protein n=1 Tax=Devosia ureilytica TaxID=2952754 RepID=A0A9Q4AQF9_9HYPH|nr:DUF4180 domain-containing protein [Devosia ureilytica]MCP8884981.1 DUF4180 domain-containing protein [Devosia ureilytica]MCP8888508.1 DUF4180 domain-containing protein [Devosia ureilytica]